MKIQRDREALRDINGAVVDKSSCDYEEPERMFNREFTSDELSITLTATQLNAILAKAKSMTYEVDVPLRVNLESSSNEDLILEYAAKCGGDCHRVAVNCRVKFIQKSVLLVDTYKNNDIF